MARPIRIEYPGAFYHVTARGNEGKKIFTGTQDCRAFFSCLESVNRRYQAVIHVYCLMNNHYHLLLETPGGNLSQILQHINGTYTRYFNIRRKRSGHLFQGRYKAILVDPEAYATELSRYIHLNPIRAGLTGRPEEYPWSSYRYYVSRRDKPDWLTVDLILGYFSRNPSVSQKDYHDFVFALVDRKYESPLRDATASTILGSKDFVHAIKERYVAGRKPDRNLPALTELSKFPILEILRATEGEWGKDNPLTKKAALNLCHRYSGRTLREIGSYFSIGESAVSQASRRFQSALEEDPKLRKRMQGLRRKLRLSDE